VASELQIKGSQGTAKIRSPLGVAVLAFVTLGIYFIVWWYKVNREMHDYGQAKGYDLGQNPTNSLLALFPGGIIIVPAVITLVNGTRRVQGAAKLSGKTPLSGWLALILYLVFSPAFIAYLQSSLNEVWTTEADLLPGQAPLPAASDGMPPKLDEQPAEAQPAAAPAEGDPPASS
jgi:hypothetical protein